MRILQLTQFHFINYLNNMNKKGSGMNEKI